jgi:uncharacterized protein DUF998
MQPEMAAFLLVHMVNNRILKLAVFAGIVGPILFGGVIILLTIVEYQFMLSLGWDPIHAPTLDWPSGLALGPYGWIMITTFFLSGLMLILFASGLRFSLPPSRVTFYATLALTLAGFSMMGLCFTTDPTHRTTPMTWHGILHDTSFVLLGLAFMPAMILLGFAFRRDPKWRSLSSYTWLTAFCAGPSFGLKGAAFYVFLLLVLIWNEVIAWRLRKFLNPFCD